MALPRNPSAISFRLRLSSVFFLKSEQRILNSLMHSVTVLASTAGEDSGAVG